MYCTHFDYSLCSQINALCFPPIQAAGRAKTLPGSYAVSLRQSRRNTRIMHVTNAIHRAYDNLRKRSANVMPRRTGTTCQAMHAGVLINGRPYEQGSKILYLPYVPKARKRHEEVVGGTLGSSQSHRVGIVNMFYLLGTEILVDITNVPVMEKCRSLYIVPTQHGDVITDMFAQIHTTLTSLDNKLNNKNIYGLILVSLCSAIKLGTCT